MAVISNPPKYFSSTGQANCQAPVVAVTGGRPVILPSGRNVVGYHINPSVTPTTIGYPI